MESARHTLLLVQFNSNLASRTFLDYESLALAMDGVCALYEKELKVLNPKVVNITYDISDLYSYLDQLADISLLVYVRKHLVAAIVFLSAFYYYALLLALPSFCFILSLTCCMFLVRAVILSQLPGVDPRVPAAESRLGQAAAAQAFAEPVGEVTQHDFMRAARQCAPWRMRVY